MRSRCDRRFPTVGLRIEITRPVTHSIPRKLSELTTSRQTLCANRDHSQLSYRMHELKPRVATLFYVILPTVYDDVSLAASCLMVKCLRTTHAVLEFSNEPTVRSNCRSSTSARLVDPLQTRRLVGCLDWLLVISCFVVRPCGVIYQQTIKKILPKRNRKIPNTN